MSKGKVKMRISIHIPNPSPTWWKGTDCLVLNVWMPGGGKISPPPKWGEAGKGAKITYTEFHIFLLLLERETNLASYSCLHSNLNQNRMKSFPALILLIASMLISLAPATAQKVMKVQKASYFDKTPPLRDMKLFVPGPRDRSWKDGVIRNEDSEREFNNNPNPLPDGPDPVWQHEFGFRDNPGIVANFDGVPNLNEVYPPDTDGDVGPEHYFQMINLSFQIFDKEGNTLFGPADNRTLWNGFIGPWTGTNDGDPIILYDEGADRWIATQFAIHTQDGTFWELVAVSETGDPTGAYYRYAFEFPAFNDYPKMGVWPDGYYLSFNMFGDDYRRAAVCALERDAMLAGDTNARMILFDMPEDSEPWSLLPADFDGNPPDEGTPNYFIYAMDDAFGSGDYLSIWEFKSDWTDPENSTFEEIIRLEAEPFKSHFCNASLGACLPQPEGGPNLEALSDRLMFRLQYRNFIDYEVMVTNHTVNVGVDGARHAGIRWYEMRNLKDGSGWFIYQQGTYAPDEHHRWMGSIAMDGRGYIALGFSIVSPTQYPNIRYTGRSPNDPPGMMTFYEEEIFASTGVQTGSAARWGDYSMMSVDPTDDTTFWFTTEYVRQTGQVSWRTRIAGFTMVEDLVAPADVTSLAATANTTNAVTLDWIATGDNGNTGTAFLYDIRYSVEPITEENFETATQVENTPSPAEAGSPETFIVENLDFSTAYYFALKVRDRQFNYTGLSNVVQASTPGAPQISLGENPLARKIFPGSIGTTTYTIQNSGASDLHYMVHKDALEREASNGRSAGDVLGTYSNGANAISGIAWVGDILFMTDLQNNYLLRYDTSQQMITDTVAIHDSPFSIAWDGEYLWIGDNKGDVYAYNPDGTSAGFSFSCPRDGFSTLAWDGSHFLTNYIMDNNPTIYRLDGTGQVAGSFKASINGMKIWQLAYVYEHYQGHYWFTNNSGKIGQIMENEDGTGNLVQQFAAPSGASYALAHDQSDLWYGKNGGTLYRIDDGIDEVNWLLIDPDAGVIPSAEFVDLSLQFDAGSFDYGNYYANMTILSNDPGADEIVVPVDLQVTGISIGPDTSFCGHLSITLDAGEGFAGYSWSDGSIGQTNAIDSTLYGVGMANIWVDVTDIGGTVKRDSISINFLDCTSIFEFSSGMTISVFPNPNHGQFTIQAKGADEQIDLRLTDLSGKVILEKEMASPGKEEFDISNYPKGNYILRLSAGAGIRVEKVILR